MLHLGLIYYSCLGIRQRQHAWRTGAGRGSEKVRHRLGEWMCSEEWTAGIALVAEKEQNNKEIWHKKCNSFRDNWQCLVRVCWLWSDLTWLVIHSIFSFTNRSKGNPLKTLSCKAINMEPSDAMDNVRASARIKKASLPWPTELSFAGQKLEDGLTL